MSQTQQESWELLGNVCRSTSLSTPLELFALGTLNGALFLAAVRHHLQSNLCFNTESVKVSELLIPLKQAPLIFFVCFLWNQWAEVQCL